MAAVSIRNSTLFADANLQALWELENVNDSKNSYTLTNNGTTPFNAALFSNGMDQGTSNSTKSLSRTDSIGINNGSTAFTVMGWIKLNEEIAAGGQYIMYLQAGTSLRECSITYEYNGGTRRVRFVIYHNNGGDTTYNVYSTAALGTSNWHHLAFVYNGSNLLEGFVDGSSVGTAAPNTAVGSATSAAFELGGVLGGGQTSAILDDWSLFNRVLTSTEISNHYSGADALPSGGKSLFFNQL